MIENDSLYERTETVGPRETSANDSPGQQPAIPDNWDAALTWDEDKNSDPVRIADTLAAVNNQPLSPRDVIRSVAVAARKWPALADRYDFQELLRIGFDVFVQNAARTLADRNPRGFIYRIAWRAFRKLDKEEHGKQSLYLDNAPVDDDGKVIPIDEAHGASGTVFALPASPDTWSQIAAEAMEQRWFQDMLGRLPDAMDRLEPIERRIVRLYYGLDDIELTGAQIAELLKMPVSTVYYRLGRAVEKLREYLDLDARRAA